MNKVFQYWKIILNRGTSACYSKYPIYIILALQFCLFFSFPVAASNGASSDEEYYDGAHFSVKESNNMYSLDKDSGDDYEGEIGVSSMYANSAYTLFESGQVKPLALAKGGRLLLALNTPDSKVEVFKIRKNGRLTWIKHIPVGLEPVSIAVRNHDEAWVVNHLSDSVSVIDLHPSVMDVVTTLQVGDEPYSVVFAGEDNGRAFVTAAHRGQNTSFNSSLTEPGVGRADIWVFDAKKVIKRKTFSPEKIINLFTNTPRAMAVSADGNRVFVAGFKTGNQTSIIPHSVVEEHGGNPEPRTDFVGIEQPATAIIVKYSGSAWLDDTGRDWSEHVKLSLPDQDVFVIDARAQEPRLLPNEGGFYTSVGTSLFGMGVNPVNNNVYVSNLDAHNHLRFSGPGFFSGHSINGRFIDNRISILKPSGEVMHRQLNPHIDYDRCCDAVPNRESEKSLALPNDIVVTQDGRTLYVAAYGSSKIGVFDTKALEHGDVVPDENRQIQVSGGGPSGMVLHERRGVMYVLTRFNNSIAVIDLAKQKQVKSIPLYNPEPQYVVDGRSLLYDAAYTSGHGDSACASCHLFGDMDGLAWDLGNPDSTTVINPGPVLLDFRLGEGGTADFRALKGPMTTQSMRGMANHGPMHWRGDRTAGNYQPTAQPDSGNYNEVEAFKQFNDAFTELMGRNVGLSDEEMNIFAEYALDISYPPNPIRNLDNSLTEDQLTGREFFFGPISDAFFNCEGCHTLNPAGNEEFGVKHPGFYGTNGRYSNDVVVPQVVKVPHLRNLYQKIGMFGIAPAKGVLTDLPNGENIFMGDQVSGFGYGHDGTFDTVFRFIRDTVFSFRTSQFPGDPGNEGGFTDDEAGDILRRQVESYVLAFDSNLKPIVGQQETVSDTNAPGANRRVALMMSQAEAGACDLIVKNSHSGFLYLGGDRFLTDIPYFPNVTHHQLKHLARKGVALTYMCVPLGSGLRLAVDRDLDGQMDGVDEIYQ